jgi:hypothetical protein
MKHILYKHSLKTSISVVYLKNGMSPVRSVGQEAKIGQRFLRTSGLSFRLGQNVGELDEQLSKAFPLIRRQCLQKGKNGYFFKSKSCIT